MGIRIIFLAGFIKLNGAVHVGIIGQGQGRHIVFFGFDDQGVYFRQGIKQGIMGVGMEVNEFRGHKAIIQKI